MYKVTVDKKKCIGCGTCVAVCSEVFEMDGDKAKPKTPKTDKECAVEAEGSCPVQAIKVTPAK